MCISAYHFITVLFLVLPCITILSLYLLSTNHKCIQPCYFSLLLKSFYCSVLLRVVIVFRDINYVIIILYS
jgi:hypothetical protein